MKRNRTHRERNRTSSIFEPLERRQLMSGGELDPSFSGDGWTNVFLGPAPLSLVATDVAVQSDGKTVVVGTESPGNGDSYFAVTRFNVNGSRDRTFGSPTDFGTILTEVGGSHSEANAVAIQPDGKIVVVGSSSSKFAIVRYNSDGSLDKTFDGDGKRTFAIKDRSSAYAVELQKDGKIVIAGGDNNGRLLGEPFHNNSDFAVARLNPNGSFDGTFGFLGKAMVAMGAEEHVNDIAIDYTGTPATNPHYGKIILVGEQDPNNLGPPKSIVLARLNPNGKRDYSFGDLAGAADTEFVVTRFPNHRDSSASSVLMQPDGKIVIAGTTGDQSGPSNQFALARYLPSGKLDKTFGTSGTGLVETGFGGADRGFDLVQSADGGLILGGLVDGNFALAAYDINGRLDTTFGAGGMVKLPVGKASSAGLAVAPDQRLVIAGGSGFTVARVLPSRPMVEIHGHYQIASEAGANNGSVVITRNSAALPLRVFFNIGGTATLNADYTYSVGPTFGASAASTSSFGFGVGGLLGNILGGNAGGGASVIGGGVGGIIGGGGGVITSTFTPYVDFAAGQTSATITLKINRDTLFEPAETATFTLAPDPTYLIQNGRNVATVGINDDDEVHVNFQPAGAPAPAGYVADTGAVFGDRGAGTTFGWDKDNTANARRRNSPGSPDARYDTYTHIQKRGGGTKWELAVPNGLYQVRIVAGDSSATDSLHAMNLEGTPVLIARPGVPTPDARWFRSTANVLVRDGRLTLSNYSEAKNNKIAFIDIKAAPVGANPEVITPVALPVRLKTAATASQWTAKGNGLFADKQIDEPLWA